MFVQSSSHSVSTRPALLANIPGHVIHLRSTHGQRVKAFVDLDGCLLSNEPSGFPFHAANISTTSNGSCGSRDVKSVFPKSEEQCRGNFQWYRLIMSKDMSNHVMIMSNFIGIVGIVGIVIILHTGKICSHLSCRVKP